MNHLSCQGIILCLNKRENRWKVSPFCFVILRSKCNCFSENFSEIFGACRKQVLECTEEASSYKDITDGTLYKNFYKEVHSESGDRTCFHLSLMISTDGAPVFKSIQCSIWPLYLCILDLPSQKRFLY